jgi:vanillate O-demethylase ferredoxin subunit
MPNHAATLNKHVLVVRAIKDEASQVRSFELALDDNADLPPVEAGAHLAVHLGNGLTRQYSLFDEPGTKNSYRVAVLKDPQSRGGSQYMHEQVKVGDKLPVSGPFNNFPLSPDAASAVLIAGGIGVTPILSMAHHLHRCGTPFELFYCARSEQEAAFVELLKNAVPFKQSVRLYFDGGDPSKGLDVKALLATIVEGRHLYCCGPGGLMNAVDATSSHWPAGTVHFERFKAEPVATAQNSEFRVYLARSRVELAVPCDKTILKVLKEAGFEIDTVCEEGVCGSCLTDVLEGVPEHRDQILTDDEKRANDVMAVCCSRAKSGRLVLDL